MPRALELAASKNRRNFSAGRVASLTVPRTCRIPGSSPGFRRV
jgi:hypothetical protein